MKATIFSGVVPALMTPCKADRSPDFDAMVRKAKQLMYEDEIQRAFRMRKAAEQLRNGEDFAALQKEQQENQQQGQQSSFQSFA